MSVKTPKIPKAAPPPSPTQAPGTQAGATSPLRGIMDRFRGVGMFGARSQQQRGGRRSLIGGSSMGGPR